MEMMRPEIETIEPGLVAWYKHFTGAVVCSLPGYLLEKS